MDNPYDSGLFEHAAGTHYLHLLREVLLTYRQLMRELTRNTGLSAGQFEVLRELAVAGGRSTVSGVSRALGIDPAAVSRVIAGLQGLDLVSRAKDDRDGRRQPVILTDKGRGLMAAFHAEAHKREGALAAGLDPESIDTAMRVLRTLRDALDSMSKPTRWNR